MTPTNPLSKSQLLHRFLNSRGFVTIEPPAKIPDELVDLCERFIEGDMDDEELIEFDEITASKPWLLTYLDRLPIPSEEELALKEQKALLRTEKLRQRCLELLPEVDESFDFSILFNPDNESLGLVVHRGGQEINSFEMAHSQGERTAISHDRSTKHFHLTITISYAEGATFDMSIKVEAIDLTIDVDQCQIQISRIDTGKVVQTESVANEDRVVDFTNLTEGAYKFEFLYGGTTLEYFKMNLTRAS
jgi:hypothetical protein